MFPTNDYVFHRIFGREGNENITKEFLNTILSQKVERIRLDSNPIMMRDFSDDKESVLDVKAILDENGEKKICNIEIQVKNEHNIKQRLPYYWARAYIEQLHKGEGYSKLCKTICILIADFELEKDDPDFFSEYGILKKRSKLGDKLLTEDLEMYIIELPKLKRKLKNEEKIDNEKLVSWLKFISNPNEMEEKDMEEENMKDAIRILEDINSNKYERDWAERRLDWCRRRIDEKEWAKKEGHEEGRAEGLQEGRIEGKREGNKEAKKEVAKKMLSKNISIEEIMEFTNLTKEEIEKLK
ncbi:MAG: Rpn family recombination-promoting nuclease/putative transposase [Clostridia bacterium]